MLYNTVEKCEVIVKKFNIKCEEIVPLRVTIEFFKNTFGIKCNGENYIVFVQTDEHNEPVGVEVIASEV